MSKWIAPKISDTLSNYDNAVSGKAIMNDLTWKKVSDVTGNAVISFPSSFKELRIVSYAYNDDSYFIKTLSLQEIYQLAVSSYIYDGYYLTSTNNGACAWQLNSDKTGIKCISLKRNGSDMSGSIQTRLYYR